MFAVYLIDGSAKLRFHELSFLLNRLDAEALRYVLLEQSSSHLVSLLPDLVPKVIQLLEPKVDFVYLIFERDGVRNSSVVDCYSIIRRHRSMKDCQFAEAVSFVLSHA